MYCRQSANFLHAKLYAVSLYVLHEERETSKSSDPFLDPKRYKQSKRIRDEDKVPQKVKEIFANQIVDYSLYDVENCQALRNFEPVQMNTHCTFAKKAVLWGARDYDTSLSVGG